MLFLRGAAVRSILCCAVILLTAFATRSALGQSATLILVNGRIWTENPRQPESDAIAIEGNRIIAVDSSAAIRKLAAPNCQIVDLGGRRVVPGFNDSHVHFLGGGDALTSVQLHDASSPEELRRRIGEYAKSLPKGAWIRNGLWDHTLWTPAVLPTHQLIDGVTSDIPVFVWRIDGHMALANGLALKLAGVDRNTKDVPGGEIVRDKEGNPTGILKDHATSLVESVMPPPSERELDAALEAAMREAASHGVTSVQNMWDSTTDPFSAVKLREFQKFERGGKLTVRIYHASPLREWKSLADTGVQAGFGDPVLRIGNLKSFADGALGSETAWMEAPFADKPGYSGLASADLTDSARGTTPVFRRPIRRVCRSRYTQLVTARFTQFSTCSSAPNGRTVQPTGAFVSNTCSTCGPTMPRGSRNSESLHPCSPTMRSTTVAGPRRSSGRSASSRVMLGARCSITAPCSLSARTGPSRRSIP